MSRFRCLAGSIVLVSAAMAAAPLEAAFHQWRFAEIYSSADGTVQFIELLNPTLATGETVSSTAEIRTDSGNVYDFPGNLSGNTANKRLLIATDDFELLPGGVTPNFSTSIALPANFFNPAGDRLRLFVNGFGEFTSVTWNAATAVPTDNVFSRLFNTSVCATCTPAGIAANSPTNFNGSNPGMTGSINRGDYNSDGVVDAADYAAWLKAFGESASPAGSGADGNTSGSIDNGDYALWTNRFGNAIVGAGGGNGGSSFVPEPATLTCLLLAWTALLPRRRRRS